MAGEEDHARLIVSHRHLLYTLSGGLGMPRPELDIGVGNWILQRRPDGSCGTEDLHTAPPEIFVNLSNAPVEWTLKNC